jgi:hypothetical protein
MEGEVREKIQSGMMVDWHGRIKEKKTCNEPRKQHLSTPITRNNVITRAAQVDSAKEPKRSELMPATSPTLSPTLSAITAGLRGSSSGMPKSHLPT